MSNIEYNPSLNDKVNGQLGDLNVGIQIPLSSIKDLIMPYKVYTALLNQSGADDPLSLSEGDDLTIGVTYLIDDGTDFDFTNVGAPNNDIGTYFVATGTTPNSWGIDGLLQYNLGAPTVTVLENTIGNIWFTYSGVGIYKLNNLTLTDPSKLYFSITSISGKSFGFAWNDEDGSGAFILTRGSGGAFQDSSLSNTPIEIRVYN